MIYTFPDLYPDELLYSGCARYSERMGFPSRRATMQDLFGIKRIGINVQLPSRLSRLVAQIPRTQGLSEEILIQKHTLFPYYANFMTIEKRDELFYLLFGDDAQRAITFLGRARTIVKSHRFLRYCPACVLEDRTLFGECYWHREHQLPGVDVCAKHAVFLIDSNIMSGIGKGEAELVTTQSIATDIKPLHINPANRSESLKYQISKQSFQIIKQEQDSCGTEQLRENYLYELLSRGLAAHSLRIKASSLMEQFNGYFPLGFLKEYNCEIAPYTENNWLLRLFRGGDKYSHPLFHLLLWQWFEWDLEKAFKKGASPKYFGQGPWPCLNPICMHYRVSVIKTVSVTIRGDVYGTFACECGFTYTRKGPDVSEDDRLRVGKVADYGALWIENFKRLWMDETVTLGEITKRFNIYSETARQQAVRLGLPYPRAFCKKNKPSKMINEYSSEYKDIHSRRQSRQERHRNTITKILNETPDIGTASIVKNAPGAYNWLMKHDQEWLTNILPDRRAHADYGSSRREVINWKRRDEQFHEAVYTTAEKLIRREGKPLRITVALIARTIGEPALLQGRLTRMPKTKEALQNIAETREEFLIRRILWALHEFQQSHIIPTRYQLARRAGATAKGISQMSLVQEALNKALGTLRGQYNL